METGSVELGMSGVEIVGLVLWLSGCGKNWRGATAVWVKDESAWCSGCVGVELIGVVLRVSGRGNVGRSCSLGVE